MAVAGVVAISEAHRPTHGIAGGLGVAVMAIGIGLALAGAGAGAAIGIGAAALLAAGGAGGIGLVVTRSGAVRRRRVRGGAEGLIGQIGVVRSWSVEEGGGRVSLAGALWHARRSAAPEDPFDEFEEFDGPGETGGPGLQAGDRVVVENLSGLTVSVRPAEDWELL
jgi:membrane-bound ClpP family serine protease